MAIELDDITVVLPTRNESKNIGRFLKSLPENIKLILIDASDDSTADIVKSTRPHYTTIIRHRGTVTEARSLGVEMATTSWLIFTDADVVFSERYFINLVNLEDCDLIYGPKLSLDYYTNYYKWFAYGQYLIHLLGVPAASGSNLVVSRQAYEKAGGFDLELTCNEDSELAWRVRRTGFKTNFLFNLVVYAHDHKRLQKGLIRKTLHSITRCAALYFDVLPSKWRNYDWGYWA